MAIMIRAAVALTGLAFGVSAADSISATSNLITWQGRTVREREVQEDVVNFSWEGVQAMINVQGATRMNMTLASTFAKAGAEPRFRIFVNGVLTTNLTVGQQSHAFTDYTLVTGLDSSVSHQVTVWYITDPVTLDWNMLPNQWLSIKSFSTDGSFATPPEQRQRRLQIIGDSITAGNQINKQDCKPDHSGTYGALLCEHFKANCTTLAISGKGIYKNCCDSDVTMSELYKRIIVGDPTLLYDNRGFVPDAVLLNLGTNDQGHVVDNITIEGFTQTYADFLVNLTQVHGNPALPIFCGVGPITSVYAPWVKDAMYRAQAKGVSSLYYLDFSSCTIDGCDHPGWIGHQEMFEVAKPIISARLGWGMDSYVDTVIV